MKAQIPNIITSLNLFCGCIAIAYVFLGKLDLAPYFVIMAMILDFFDGFAARLLKTSSELGKQMDSLADVVSFGVVPGVIVFQLLNIHFFYQDGNFQGNLTSMDVLTKIKGISGILPFTGFLIPVFSAFRLAKFNIDTEQTEGFRGLNTPTNALFFISLPLFFYAHPQGYELLTEYQQLPLILITLCIGMSLLLITRIPMFSLKFKAFIWRGNAIRFCFLTLVLLVIFLELIVGLYFLSMPLIVFLYLTLSLVENYILKK